MDDSDIVQFRGLQVFCERVCRNTNALYAFVEPAKVVFMWHGFKVCETTELKIHEAIAHNLQEDFAVHLQKLIFDYVNRVSFGT